MADDKNSTLDSAKEPPEGGFLGLQDSYERYARLAPALLTMAPIGLALTALPTGDVDWLKPVIAVVSACGGTLLLAAIARTAGRTAQDTVFADGLPTLRALRHREAETKAELAELHRTVTEATGVALPTAEAEDEDPAEADGVYRIAIRELIDATRDQSKFELLHKENRNYGFSRNLFGLRPIGRILSVLGAAAGAALLIVAIVNGDGLDIGLAIATVVVGVIASLVFFLWLTPARVVVPATAYRDRLFEAARTLG